MISLMDTTISTHRREHSYIVLNPEESESLNPERTDGLDEDNDGECKSEVSKETLDSKQTQDILLENTIYTNYSDLTLKLLSALFYGVCSFLITVINKIVLTSYAFPSSNILGLGQMVAIIIIIKTASLLHAVTIRRVSIRNRKMWILAALYLGNLMSGLGGTKILPLPMLIALRRFSIALTALFEFLLLGIKQSLPIVFTIAAMIGGSFIAAASDLTFNGVGYLLVMISNVLSAANGVYIKKTTDSKEINKHEILYYNALFTVLPLTIISYFTNSADILINFSHWNEIGFLLSFAGSCVMGYLLMYSTVLCTHYNSALTTTIVGTIKVSRKIHYQ